MFIRNLLHLYRSSDKVIIRNLRSRRFDPNFQPNPGLDRRIKAFEADGFKVKHEEVEEFLEQSESDFHMAGEAYNVHLNETSMSKQELRHQIVKEKYFKDNMPNLLTWSEKEQIRHLATTEPDEWTPERIAESFPVTAPVVKKLLKYPWKPATLQRIERHDASAMRNWKELKEGSLDIPPELQKHFLKFSNRTIPSLKKESVKIDLAQEEALGEFERIVQRCAEKEKEEAINEKGLAVQQIGPSTKHNEKSDKRDSKFVTLDELTAKIKNRIEKGNEVKVGDQLIIDTMKATKYNTINSERSNEVELFNDSTEQNKIAVFKDGEEVPKDIMNYPERIRIPKKAYKKGATYKVDDCYYDHDGRFLYRVLGMSSVD